MVGSRNIHGRKPTRGLRPWLLIPKILALLCLLGGMATVLVLTLIAPAPTDAAGWMLLLKQLTAIYHFLIIPAAILAVLTGLTLLLHHGPRLMLAQRWLQVKLALALPTLALLHIGSRTLLRMLRSEVMHGEPDGPRGLLQALGGVTTAGLAVLVVVVILGRLKPRLGQNWAKTYAGIGSRKAQESST